jgi:hypothetical protein
VRRVEAVTTSVSGFGGAVVAVHEVADDCCANDRAECERG